MPLHLGRHFQIGVFVIIAFIIPEKAVQASLMQFCYFYTDQSLIDQSVIIKNMDNHDLVVCKFNFTTVPHRVNCTQSETFVCVKNESYVEMFTKDQKTKNFVMEHGSGRNGHGLQATCEDMPENTVRIKVSECSKSADSSPQPPYSSNHTLWIILGVLGLGVLGVLGVLGLVFSILYKFCERFKSWVNAAFSCLRVCNTKSVIETGTTTNTNAGSSPNKIYFPVPHAPIERGQ